MFIVNGADAQGIRTSEHSTLEEALAKAAEFLAAGKFNVSILDLEMKTYSQDEIELLIEMVKAEQRRD